MRTVVLLLSSLLLLTSSASAQLGWFQQRQEGDAVLYSIDMVDSDHITAVGSEGLILQSNDGGVTWQSRASGVVNNFRRIRWYTSTLGVILGNGGEALKSVDGGSSWLPMNTGTSDALFDIHFFDDNNWLIIGKAARVLTTSNAGTTWANQGSGTNNYNEIDFRGDLGIIVGNKGTIRVTVDGGKRWRDRSGATNLELTSVSIGDDSTAIAVGINGIILRTQDKGDSWTEIPPSAPIGTVQLSGVRHLTPGRAVICGQFGLILLSTDTGLSWSAQESNTPAHLESLAFIDNKVGVAAGSGGTVIRTNTGGSLAVKRLSDAAPANVNIGAAWPNPLARNSQANVNIEIPNGGAVRLRVHDLLGRERKSIISSFMDAGAYTISWDNSALPKGVYLYRLEQRGAAQVRKFAIMD
jgi:photosystem II stability/assembly factor-like uncharacterized protein